MYYLPDENFVEGRRNRKTRYRPARFDNRRREDGWLAPSIRQKDRNTSYGCRKHLQDPSDKQDNG
ncbi:MAG: RRXRR domain-containing protein [Clostridium sp.]